jgi:hypothetical protein
MSQQLINRSRDLKQLRDEGYGVEVRSGRLLLRNVPYVNSNKEIKVGTLVSELTLAGDLTTTPSTHVVQFAGEHPCDRHGKKLSKIEHQSQETRLDEDLVVQHSFSSKPTTGGYKDYYDKMTTYATIISGPAESIDPTVTAKTFPVIESQEDESVFSYIDTATSRADIVLVTRKLELPKIAIVGLGGTGSYVLDLVSKTPVREIHLFDGDKFSQHNAFRSPGCPTIDELKEEPQKVAYFKDRYARMHRGIIAHPSYIDASNVDELRAMSFVFVCMEGASKRLIVEKLEEFGLTFIDVGMGVYVTNESLGGVVRVTTSTPIHREHVRAKNRIPCSDTDGRNEYDKNVQIADLNALNAALAVVRWKKLFGYYLDLENEHHSTYTVDGNTLTNEDQPCSEG